MRLEKHLAAATAACVMLALPFAAVAMEKKPAPAPASWQSVAKTDNQEAFVDLNSIGVVGAYLAATAKFEYATPQPWEKDKTFSSLSSVLRVDCAQRRLADRETKAHAGAGLQGDVVRKASRSEKNLIWRDAAPRTVDGEVLDFVCKNGPQAAPQAAPPPGT